MKMNIMEGTERLTGRRREIEMCEILCKNCKHKSGLFLCNVNPTYAKSPISGELEKIKESCHFRNADFDCPYFEKKFNIIDFLIN